MNARVPEPLECSQIFLKLIEPCFAVEVGNFVIIRIALELIAENVRDRRSAMLMLPASPVTAALYLWLFGGVFACWFTFWKGEVCLLECKGGCLNALQAAEVEPFEARDALRARVSLEIQGRCNAVFST